MNTEFVDMRPFCSVADSVICYKPSGGGLACTNAIAPLL
jgi:hypothetical protein